MQSSKAAYKTWGQTSILTRQAVMMKFAHIIKENMGELAKSITKEQGKTLVDAEGDVLRGLREYMDIELYIYVPYLYSFPGHLFARWFKSIPNPRITLSCGTPRRVLIFGRFCSILSIPRAALYLV